MVLLTAAIFFLIISVTVVLTVSSPLLRNVRNASEFARSRGSFFTAQGLAEDVMYRIKTGKNAPTTITLTLNEYTAQATTTTVSGGREIVVSGSFNNRYRNVKTHLTVGAGASFHYGIQSGEGGIVLENTSSVRGNVFSNGSVTGSGSNLIKGDVISGGPTGLIDSVHATSSAFAHTIRNATIDGDAHYDSISNTTVAGTLYPGSPDPATSTLPISDALIEEWKDAAEAGGVITTPCPYKITNTVTIGPVKINCDLEISGTNFTVTLAGPLWVSGDIDIKNSPTIKVSSSISGQSVAVVADKESDRANGGQITLQNSATFEGTGSNSYILFVSQNNSAESGGSEKAISVKNSANGDLLVYAGHGEIELQNNVDLKEVTAYRIRLKNSAEVIYESGMADLIFSSGPGGGYIFDAWREVE